MMPCWAEGDVRAGDSDWGCFMGMVVRTLYSGASAMGIHSALGGAPFSLPRFLEPTHGEQASERT